MTTRSRESLQLSAQLNAEWQRSGINFRIMLVGESGLGKTTFTRALLRPFVPDDMLHGAAYVPATLTARPSPAARACMTPTRWRCRRGWCRASRVSCLR